MSIDFKILLKVAGDCDKRTNDIIIFPTDSAAKYNLIFFSGDVQVNFLLFLDMIQNTLFIF
jgi:hypothetical protein